MLTRRQAREWAIQMLAAADMNPPDNLDQFKADFWQQVCTLDREDGGYSPDRISKKLRAFAEERFDGIWNESSELDGILEGLLENWSLPRLGVVERAVLRLGAWELKNTDIPAAIIINECIDLVNWYASPKSRGIVNGVLDRYAKSLEGVRLESDKKAKASGV